MLALTLFVIMGNVQVQKDLRVQYDLVPGLSKFLEGKGYVAMTPSMSLGRWEKRRSWLQVRVAPPPQSARTLPPQEPRTVPLPNHSRRLNQLGAEVVEHGSGFQVRFAAHGKRWFISLAGPDVLTRGNRQIPADDLAKTEAEKGRYFRLGTWVEVNESTVDEALNLADHLRRSAAGQGG